MVRSHRLLIASTISAAVAWIALPGVASAAPAPVTCTSTLGAGTYGQVTVPAANTCEITGAATTGPFVDNGTTLVDPDAALTVNGGMVVGANAIFAAPQNSSPIDIEGSVAVGPNGVFVVGTEDPFGPPVNRIAGNVLGNGETSVQIHNAVIGGSVGLQGGGADNPAADALSGGFPLNFNDLEDNQIGGTVSVNGYSGVWAGVIRNQIGGNLVFTNNTNNDEFDIGSNVIRGLALCANNNPVVDTGESPGEANTVAGALDSCEAPVQT